MSTLHDPLRSTRRRAGAAPASLCLAAWACAALLVFSAGAPAYSPSDGEFPPFKEGTHGPAFLKMDRGLPVLHLFGSHKEMGEQAGTLLGPQARHLIEHYIHALIPEEGRKRLDASVRGFEFRIPRELREELKAFAEAAEIDYFDILLANCIVDLGQIVACSSLTLLPEKSKSAELMLGRNLDYLNVGGLEEADVVFVYHGDGTGPAVASVGWPGMIGVTTGMNSDGLSLAMLVSLSSNPKFAGLPSVVAFRHYLETQTKAEEAVEFFARNNVILPTNLSLADAAGNALVIELNPYTGNALRRPTDGFLPCTNFFASPLAAETSNDPRFKYLEEAARGAARHDYFDLRNYLVQTAPDGDTRMANLQTMILLPEKRVMFLSAKTIPAAEGKLLRFDLKKLFEAKPANAGDEKTKSAPEVAPAAETPAADAPPLAAE